MGFGHRIDGHGTHSVNDDYLYTVEGPTAGHHSPTIFGIGARGGNRNRGSGRLCGPPSFRQDEILQ